MTAVTAPDGPIVLFYGTNDPPVMTPEEGRAALLKARDEQLQSWRENSPPDTEFWVSPIDDADEQDLRARGFRGRGLPK